MTHKHTWKKSKRRHRQKGRYFCFCTDPNCPDGPGEWQYTDTHPPFRTNAYRGGSRIISIRVTDEEYKNYIADKDGFKRKAKNLLLDK